MVGIFAGKHRSELLVQNLGLSFAVAVGDTTRLRGTTPEL
jgi:hypothetical protein